MKPLVIHDYREDDVEDDELIMGTEAREKLLHAAALAQFSKPFSW